jgi:hypothetical protein
VENSKYGQYVVRKQIEKHEPWPTMEWTGGPDFNTDVTFMVTRVKEPCIMEEFPHTHNFDMYLYFFSYDPDDMDGLPAEIEISMGPEREVHTITSPTGVYIPKGMVHAPLNFKRVDKPILLLHTSIASDYVKDQIIKD